MTIELGPFAKPISVQLKGVLPDEDLAILDRHNEAISRCVIFGFITKCQGYHAQRRLMDEIQSLMDKRGQTTNNL